jgi:hypothetical protein
MGYLPWLEAYLKRNLKILPWYQGGCWSQDLVLVLGLWVSCSWDYNGFASISSK